jgi:predicted RNase H-like HicB family nuclease
LTVWKAPLPNHNYTIVIEPASAEDGGGFLAFVPDLPGCMSDGDTVAGAIDSWIEAATEMGRPVPAPALRQAVV